MNEWLHAVLPSRLRVVARLVPIVLLGLCVAAPLAAQAAYVQVRVREKGHSERAMYARIEIRCPANDSLARWVRYSVNAQGRYRLKAPGRGWCGVRVIFKKHTSTMVRVYFTSELTRVNLELRPTPSGWMLLRH